jgi:hypothetical protein
LAALLHCDERMRRRLSSGRLHLGDTRRALSCAETPRLNRWFAGDLCCWSWVDVEKPYALDFMLLAGSDDVWLDV